MKQIPKTILIALAIIGFFAIIHRILGIFDPQPEHASKCIPMPGNSGLCANALIDYCNMRPDLQSPACEKWRNYEAP